MSIKKRLKTVLVEEDIKLKELAALLAEKRNAKVLPNAISQKINRESIKFNEVEEILDLIGYDVIFQKREQ